METLNFSSIGGKENQGAVAIDDMEENVLLAKDEIHLLNIFPAEIWDSVSEHLSDCELHNLSNNSPFFRKRLFNKRKLFLFRTTFQHLIPYLVRSEGEEGTGSTILDCRVVCQTWNLAVDWYLENPKFAWCVTQFITNAKEQRTLHNAQTKEFLNDDDGGKKLFKFLHQFPSQALSSTTRNPFIGRTVNLAYSEDLDINSNCINAISTLFQRYGKHIHSLKILLWGTNPTSKSYSALAQWLGHAANLRSLKIICFPVDDAQMDLDQMPTFSVPKFQHLKSLQLDNLPNSLVNNLIWENSQNLTELILQQEIHQPNEIYNPVCPVFPNMKKFSGLIKSFDQMQNLVGFFKDCELNSLHLNFDNLSPEDNSVAASLECFETLQLIADKWGNTLDTLELYFLCENSPDQQQKYLHESANLKLNLPCLGVFRLAIACPIHFDFLLAAKNTLRIVDMTTGEVALEGGLEVASTLETTVQFLGFEQRMYESNIWKLFPEIKVLITHPNGGRCMFWRTDVCDTM